MYFDSDPLITFLLGHIFCAFVHLVDSFGMDRRLRRLPFEVTNHDHIFSCGYICGEKSASGARQQQQAKSSIAIF